MTSATDRIQGLSGSLAVKPPVRTATTVAITLSGLQTVGGVSLAAGDRVLVKDQASAADNGIYTASTSTWARALDANGANDLRNGTLVYDASASKLYRLTGTDPISPGTTAITATDITVREVMTLDDIEYLRPETGAVASTAQSKFQEALSVLDFGAVGDDSTDDTAAIQAALAAAALAGGSVYLPPLTYKITAALVIDNHHVRVFGAGIASKIKTYSTTLNVFTVAHSGGVEIENIRFADFSVTANAAMSSGAAFACTKAARCSWHNVFLAAPEDCSGGVKLHDGITLDRFDYCVISNCHILTTHDGVACNGETDGSFGAGLYITGGCKINGQATGAGVHVGGAAGGVVLGEVDVIGCNYGVRVSTARQAGVANRELFLGAGCTVDSAPQSGIIVEADAITHLSLSGTWVGSCGVTNTLAAGIDILAPNAALVLTAAGARIYNNAGGGLIAAAGDVSLTGCAVWANGVGADVTVGNGYGNGVWTSGAGVYALRLVGNKIDSNGSSGASAGYNVKVATGIDNLLLADNTLHAGVAGNVSYSGGLDGNHRIIDNPGYVTRNSGTAAITVGNTSVIVTHGLTADRGARVNVTPATAAPEDLFYAGTPGTTTFTIGLATAASGTNNFTWEAYSI